MQQAFGPMRFQCGRSNSTQAINRNHDPFFFFALCLNKALSQFDLFKEKKFGFLANYCVNIRSFWSLISVCTSQHTLNIIRTPDCEF